MRKTWDRQTQAFLEHLGIVEPAQELPEPISAEWTRRDERVERMMFDVRTFEPFARFDEQVVFDGEEVYLSSQLNDAAMRQLSEAGDVSFEYDGRQNTVTVRRRGVRREDLPRYVQVDIVAGARGGGRFRYRNGR